MAVDLFSGSTRITGATTAASGTYSVGVADGTYDIVVTPPTGSGLTASTFSAFTGLGIHEPERRSCPPGSDVFWGVAYYSGCADAADNGVADGVVYRFDDDVFDGRVFTRGCARHVFARRVPVLPANGAGLT